MPSWAYPLSVLMRLLASRTVGVTAMLVLAGAVAVSAPLGHSMAGQSTAIPPIGKVSQALHRQPIASPAATPSAQSPVVTAPTRAPAPRPASTAQAHVAIGTGQWGLINQDRAAAGLPPLRWNACLAAIATQNAARMAAQGFISHTNGPTLDLGCRLGSRAGENVGYLSNGINDVKMNAMFMASPAHRANILGPYRYVGVAWVVAPNGNAYIAVEFS